ncbi:ABC transporter permease [Kineococcus sp. R8]|uniref:YhgE/Pip family protein n=1 Tax=Kineococcus siccus TaxID=2696567 RepID=UPI0014131065|nr:ABC transporter permease [Kineococcus siccus]
MSAAGQGLAGAVQQLGAARQGVDELAAGADRLATGATAVSDGAAQLARAAPALAGGVASAADGAAALATGTRQVSAGATSAAAGAERLAAGSGTLDTGAQELATGAGTARDGAARLADGTAQLADGSTQLADGLRSGADAVPTYGDADRAQRSQVAAAPVQSRATRAHAVDVYGEGLAPYFVCLALWIGGMITYMVLRAVSPRALATTAGSWRAALSGWLPGAAFGVVQAVALFASLHVFLGFDAASPWATVAFAVLVAVVFTSIHQCFTALLGGVGRLVALVLLMLQLASAGGTYPVATAGPFFEALSPYLPMTYGVQGLRRLVAEGATAQVWTDVGALVVAGLLAIGVTLLACHRRRTWSVTRLHPSLSL